MSGKIIIARKEFICDLSGASNYTVQNYFMNPGNSSLVAWLSQAAPNWEKYRFTKARMVYKTTCSDLTLNGVSVGTVMMGGNYNVTQPNWDGKNEFLQYAGTGSCKINENMIWELNLSKVSKLAIYITDDISPLSMQGAYSLNGVAGSTIQDPKTFFACNFQIATQGLSAYTGGIGELYIDYEVELSTPRLYNELGNAYELTYFYSIFPTASGAAGLWGNGSGNNLISVNQGGLYGGANTMALYNATTVANLAQQIPGTTGGFGHCNNGSIDIICYRFPDSTSIGTYTFYIELFASTFTNTMTVVGSGNITISLIAVGTTTPTTTAWLKCLINVKTGAAQIGTSTNQPTYFCVTPNGSTIGTCTNAAASLKEIPTLAYQQMITTGKLVL